MNQMKGLDKLQKISFLAFMGARLISLLTWPRHNPALTPILATASAVFVIRSLIRWRSQRREQQQRSQ